MYGDEPYAREVGDVEDTVASRGLTSSTFQLKGTQVLWDTLGGVNLSVTNTAPVKLRSGRV